jgi:hypothetical protein
MGIFSILVPETWPSLKKLDAASVGKSRWQQKLTLNKSIAVAYRIRRAGQAGYVYHQRIAIPTPQMSAL